MVFRAEMDFCTNELADLREVVENSPYAVAMLDRDMRYVYTSHRWLADYRLRLSNEEIRGRSHYEVFPEIPAHWREIHRRCLAGDVARNEAEPFVRADGSIHWLRWEIRPWHDATGAVGGILLFTEDISAERRVAEERRRWEEVFHNAAWGMSLSTPDNRFIVVNQAFARMHGTEPDEWVGRSLLDMFAEESKPMLPELVRRTHEAGHIQYESVHVRKDGSTFPVLTEVTVFRDESGAVAYRAGNFLDITRRKAAEQALDAERTKLVQLLDEAPVAVALFEGPEHHLAYANRKHAELAGKRFVGKRLLDAFPEVAGQPILAVLDAVYRTGVVRAESEFPIRFVRNGVLQEGFFNVTQQPIYAGGGRITGVMTTSVEVTEQVRARQQVEEARVATEKANRLIETIVSNASLGLVMMDARQHCTFLNAAAEKMFGFRLGEVQSKPLHDFVHHCHPDGTPYPMEECPIDRALPTKNQERGEDVFVHPDGHFYPVAFTASPIVVGGVPVGTVIEVRDTTEEKEAERRLRAAIAVRDEFLAIASHELRTPLTALSLQLERLQRLIMQAAAPEQSLAAKSLTRALRQVKRLEVLIDGLLNVSRMETGPLQLRPSSFDLGELVGEVIERLSETASRAQCEIRLEAQPAVGSWDRERVDEVVENLLANAIKYGPGEPIDVRLAADEEFVVLTIRDRGIGIAPESQERIFGRFERAVPVKNYGGLGLGLYIARQIVDAHGGTISVKSEPGAGATFKVRLPRGRMSAQSAG